MRLLTITTTFDCSEMISSVDESDVCILLNGIIGNIKGRIKIKHLYLMRSSFLLRIGVLAENKKMIKDNVIKKYPIYIPLRFTEMMSDGFDKKVFIAPDYS